MEIITEWVTSIIIFVLIATVIDLLLPNSSMQKYAKMVIGLLLIAVIISPMLRLLSTDIETALASLPNLQLKDDKKVEDLIDLQKKEIQASTAAYILEETAVQLKEDVEEELMEQYGLGISNIELKVDDNPSGDFLDNLERIVVHLDKPMSKKEAVEVISLVEISTNKPLPALETEKENSKITNLLSERWDVEKEKIDVVVEGGSKK